ncbi:MAG: biotin--[acetyl-CoA-carboxylase] ligase [Deltaproteobacteria bacterium]|nr:biotin--[acetyl-CoA-carboxylase] ligase [Deltaproteobacteria bacterium]
MQNKTPPPSPTRRIIRLDHTDSTNRLVLETPEFLEENHLVVLARSQTQGRGRRGRSWVSLPGSQLLFSYVHHPQGIRGDLPVISLVAGLSVAQALEEFGAAPRLKWPNDVKLAGKKVCGILVETKPGPQGDPRVVIGIGLNCLGREEELPLEIKSIAAILAAHTVQPVDPEAVLWTVLACLDENLERLGAGEKPSLLESWRARADLAGKPVRVEGETVYSGRAVGISPEGYLLVEASGELRTVVSGDVTWLDTPG